VEVPNFSLEVFGTLFKLCLKERPQVVVTYGGPETVLAQLLKALFGFKLWRFRGNEIPDSASSLRFRLGLMGVDGVISPSNAIAQRLKALLPGKAVATVTLGVDSKKYQRVTGQRPTENEAEFVILGRLDPVKGHKEFLGIWSEFLKSRQGTLPQPVLHIVGEPANISEADLEAAIAAASLTKGDAVKVTIGRHPNISGLMSKAALGVVSSVGSEVICRVAEEFLLCGTPVMVSGVGSLDEVLFEEAGFSYRGYSQTELLPMMAKWLEKSFLESETAKDERSVRAQERFSLEAMGKSLKSVLFQESNQSLAQS
jgi:glycosyltransferase involved in cell wall biosynthesis